MDSVKDAYLKISGSGDNGYYGRVFEFHGVRYADWHGYNSPRAYARVGDEVTTLQSDLLKDGTTRYEPITEIIGVDGFRLNLDDVFRNWSTISNNLGISTELAEELRAALNWIDSVDSPWKSVSSRSQFSINDYNNNEGIEMIGMSTLPGFPLPSNASDKITNSFDVKTLPQTWAGNLTFLNGNYKAAGGVFPFEVLRMLSDSIELGEYQASPELTEWIEENKGDNPSANNVKWDIYMQVTEEKNAYWVDNVAVHWSNPAVNNHLLGYDESNCKVRIYVRKYLSSDDPVLYSEVRYGEGKVTKSIQDYQQFVGISNTIVDSILPIANTADVILVLEMEYADGSTSSLMFGQVPFNAKEGTEHLMRGYFKRDGVSVRDGSTIELHMVDKLPGIGPDVASWNSDAYDGPWDDTVKGDDDDEQVTTNPGYNTNIGLLTKTYSIDAANLKKLGNIVWDGNFTYYIDLMNNSPIENIVSVKSFPFDLPGTSLETVVLGNVKLTGVSAAVIPSDANVKKTIGTFSIPQKFTGVHKWLNYAPYTSSTIFLPYIGFRELPHNQIVGKTITLKYIYDVICGNCIAAIYDSNGIELQKWSGDIAIDIPIAASNRAQVEMAKLTNGINTGFSIASSLMSGGTNLLGAAQTAVSGVLSNMQAQYHTTSNGSPSSATDAFDEQNAFIIIDYPVYYEPTGYAHTYGYPCDLSKNLSECKGFTKCSNVDVEDIACTDTERDMIKEALERGVYL